jgi:dephospho-CoA kinase
MEATQIFQDFAYPVAITIILGFATWKILTWVKTLVERLIDRMEIQHKEHREDMVEFRKEDQRYRDKVLESLGNITELQKKMMRGIYSTS